MATKQTFTVQESSPIFRAVIHFPENTPHWVVRGNGHARLEVTIHERSKWVSFDTSEYNKLDGRTVKSEKRTMLTLDVESGRQLYAFLGKIYG